MTRPERAAALDAGAEGGQASNLWQGSQVAHHDTSPVNHRALVEGASLAELAEALVVEPDFFGFLVDETGDFGYGRAVYFRCPIHDEPPSSSLGAAHGRPDGMHFDCADRRGCGRRGTRYLLERLVLENAEALLRLTRAMG